jgi:lysophospholipase L1-like esterase
MVSQSKGEANDPYCLREGEAAALLRGHRWCRFVVVGDSVAEGLGESVPGYADQSWTDRIAAELAVEQPDLAYLNLGHRDTATAQVRATQLDQAVAFAPDLALVACGGFDALRSSFDRAGVENDLRAIVTAFRQHNCDVITVSMFDGSYNPLVPEPVRLPLRHRLRELSDLTQRVGAELGTLHVNLIDHPASHEDIYSSDARHGNQRGHAISAAETVRRLGAHLAHGMA